jgi:hypothetical protein
MTKSKKKLIFIVLLGIVETIVFVAGAIFIWGSMPLGPAEGALEALQSGDGVTVEAGHWLVFQPNESTATGFVFYPGARVDSVSYAPLARAIAQNGILVIITPMPLNLAVLGADRADDVIAAHPEIASWYVGGHSLGGAMAARYAYNHPEIKGLVLWAAYPSEIHDLSDRTDLRVVSIWASQDGLVTSSKIAASRLLLPDHTLWVTIEGGNHAQFGSYGTQKGDHPAAISPAEQQAEIVMETSAFLSGED